MATDKRTIDANVIGSWASLKQAVRPFSLPLTSLPVVSVCSPFMQALRIRFRHASNVCPWLLWASTLIVFVRSQGSYPEQDRFTSHCAHGIEGSSVWSVCPSNLQFGRLRFCVVLPTQRTLPLFLVCFWLWTPIHLYMDIGTCSLDRRTCALTLLPVYFLDTYGSISIPC